ncbi:MAG: PD40 domain-containing protein [Candidatus Marinimicrobia bacterium]|nr:PD40 domain-containing protein [Candidatus Neomarinimicrobiota bacterium]
MKYIIRILSLFIILQISLFAQFGTYNHAELDWTTFETEHFVVHYHNGTEWTAREAVKVAETVYPLITKFYDFEPSDKTELIIKDTDDIANGAAYYFDNKIDIWASPLDFELRGAHRWLRNVITHEFAHIVSLQKSMKAGRNVPAGYFQYMGYEPEKRQDVVRGYPNIIISYPIPTVVIPMWLAEGMAQFQYPGATNDYWDSHRDMIIRDRVLNDKLLSFKAMESFGKYGIGSECVYNQGFGLTKFIADKYGEDVIPELAKNMSSPFLWNINTIMKKSTGKSGEEVYAEWKSHLTQGYFAKTENIRENLQFGENIQEEGIAQLYANWAGDDEFYYLSSKGTDYFSLTSLYRYHVQTKKDVLIAPRIQSRTFASKDGRYLYYSRKTEANKHGSVFYNIYKFDRKTKKEIQITQNRRAKNPVLSKDEKSIYFVHGKNGKAEIYQLNLESEKEELLAEFDHGIQVHNIHLSTDGKTLAFDMTVNHGRDVLFLDIVSRKLTSFLTENYDERDPYFSPDGKWLYYSSDGTGIFNIYRKSLENNEIQQITNVTGGAFMPAVNGRRELIYSHFENSKYKIAYLKVYQPVEATKSEYIENYEERDFPMLTLVDVEKTEDRDYSMRYSKVFVLPKMMIDYGTPKPGFYFFTSEILDQFNLFGTFSVNPDAEHDAAALLEYKKLGPTLFLEYYDISRGLYNKKSTVNGYPGVFDYHFHLQQLILGASRPFSDFHHLRFDISLSNYKSSVDQDIAAAGIHTNGFTYDYYQGLNFMLTWNMDAMLPSVNAETNPNNGFEIKTIFYRNYDKFLEEFGVNKDYGTLKEIFRDNNYWKIEHEGKWHQKIFQSELVGNLNWRMGWISKPDIDSFFNFFAGSAPGLRGYPYYALEGRNLFNAGYTFRYPLFRQKNIKLGMFNLQNGFVGFFAEAGNAWSRVKGHKDLQIDGIIDDFSGVTKNLLKDFKRDVGMELRFSGFSFYGYPTAISFDVAYGLDDLTVIDKEDNINEYGKELRTYLTILFGL